MAYNYPRNLVLLATATASSSASIAFTSTINANFSTYMVKIRNLLPATNSTNLYLTFSSNNGSSYLNSGYQWVTQYIISGGPTGAAGSTSDTQCRIIDFLSNVSTNPLNVNIMFYNLDSSFGTMYYSDALTNNNNIPELAELRGAGQNSTTGINAIKFAISSGNIASGNFYIYGVSEP